MAKKIECSYKDHYFDPEAEENADVPQDKGPICGDCYGEKEEREWERKQKLSRDKAQEWVGRAFGAFLGCQAFDIQPPKFELGYTPYIIFTMAGRNEEIAEAAEKFVNECIPLIDAAQKAREKVANA